MPRPTTRSSATTLAASVVVAVALLALAGAAVWRLALRDTSEPASADEALGRFRGEADGTDGRIPLGVYTYATEGFESVSALGGRRHRYPARSTITVTRAACGLALRWDVLATRSNELTLCAEGADLRLSSWSERHEFFGRTDRTDWRCPVAAWLPAERAPGSASPLRCRSSDSTLDGTVTVVGVETIAVGARRVRALRLRAEARESGGARGPLVQEHWLAAQTGLPLRVVYAVRTANPSPIGDVTFEERYELRLLSLEPRR
ncbi:MAG TPA: hypothetical protein VLB86_07165 [Gaiellaceae bacterium]|nr:hypothetical protein [Gaiellaceae bacterium]